MFIQAWVIDRYVSGAVNPDIGSYTHQERAEVKDSLPEMPHVLITEMGDRWSRSRSFAETIHRH